MTRPDVTIISPYPSLDRSHHAGTSGVASYAANLARSLSAGGLHVLVVAPGSHGPPRGEQDGGVRVERCVGGGARGLRRAVGVALASRAPVVHLQFELFLYGGPPALVETLVSLERLRRSHASTVVTMHQTVNPATVDRSYTELHRVPVPAPIARLGIDGLQRAVRRLAAATVVHEEPFRDVLGGADVIPHGIEPTARLDRRAARSHLGLPEDRFLALCFGFIAPYKGLETALEAGRLAGDPVEVVIAGGEHPRLASAGDDYAGDLRRRFGDAARFTGWVPGDDVVPWFRAADVALFPYPEPFSSSGALALALACETPALVSARLGRCIGAPSHMLASSTQELAARLQRLSDDSNALAELRAWTACLAAGREWSAVADRHREVYERVAA